MKNQPALRPAAALGKSTVELNLDTPLDFVSTCRHHRRQFRQPRGQPRRGICRHHLRRQFASLPWDYAYSDQQGRATSVSSPAILEALKKVYAAAGLVHELTTGHNEELLKNAANRSRTKCVVAFAGLKTRTVFHRAHSLGGDDFRRAQRHRAKQSRTSNGESFVQ